MWLAGISVSAQKQKKPDPCANPQTQTEMTQCAAEAYKAADAVLNQVYRQLVAKLDDDEKAQLKEAQTAWLKYRDTNCDFVADQYKGGTDAAHDLCGLPCRCNEEPHQRAERAN
jgi:uncharacterized protein YecT (DUF1311 family)